MCIKLQVNFHHLGRNLYQIEFVGCDMKYQK
jgi:hypothetical protein